MIANIANPCHHLILGKLQEIARARDFDVILADTIHDPRSSIVGTSHLLASLVLAPASAG
jgi:hypothetical protein